MPSTAQEEGKYFKYTDKSYLILQGVILKDIKPRSFKMSQFFFFFFFLAFYLLQTSKKPFNSRDFWKYLNNTTKQVPK